jgi:hypothetical protein
VPFAAGSGTDAITRVVAQHLGTSLKQNIVVENRPGANGAIAATYVASSRSDGSFGSFRPITVIRGCPRVARASKDVGPATQVGNCRLGLSQMPISCKPEIGGRRASRLGASAERLRVTDHELLPAAATVTPA